MVHSGVDDFPPLPPQDLERVLVEVAGFGAQLIVHAEDAHAVDCAPAPYGGRYAGFVTSRPRGAENLAVAWLVERARWTGGRVHVLHLSGSMRCR